MNYEGNLIRPPSEANSIILQVTVGCAYNKCTFCGAYKDISYGLKSKDTIEKDISFAKMYCHRQARLFLADGDVLMLQQNYLVDLLVRIRKELPWVKRVSLYGSAQGIESKTANELNELKLLGLDRVYMGLESGCDEVLKKVQKAGTAQFIVNAGKKIGAAGIFLSVTILLGLAGQKGSEQHAKLTAKALGEIAPQQIAALTLMPLENTALGGDVRRGVFKVLGPEAILTELHTLIEHLNVQRAQFYANHASNYLPLSGRLPKNKHVLLAIIESALAGKKSLVSEQMRTL